MTTAPLILSIVLAFVPSLPSPDAGSGGAARGPVILDFHADWCQPCQQMRPRIDTLNRARYPVRSIDIDDHPELVEKYKIEGVPTFVILDGEGQEVSRRKGLVEAQELADLYKEAVGPTPVREGQSTTRQISAGSTNAFGRSNPDPWATVVRITVKDRGSLGFGSGTVIESTPEETIILTCAHIFHVKGRQPRAEQFNLPVQVELFDGKLGGPGGQTVRPLGRPIPGKVIDYDFDRDVALVKIRTGEVVPTARVVPPHWMPKVRMGMFTVGCSHGEDATAWNTAIYQPVSRYQVPGKRNYEAIECLHSPKQGRSGGGLFTEDGYVAGVCNFAFDPAVGRGLYASPASIYAILDQNNLSHLYEYRAPRGPKLEFANNSGVPRNDSATAGASDPSTDIVYRGQNARIGDAVASNDDRTLNVNPIVVPRPEYLGIRLPDEASDAWASNPNAIDRRTVSVTPEPAAGRADRPGPSAWTPVVPGNLANDHRPSTDPRRANHPGPAPVASGSGGGSGSGSTAPATRSGWSKINPRG